jgi:hypothetical protein
LKYFCFLVFRRFWYSGKDIGNRASCQWAVLDDYIADKALVDWWLKWY